MGVSVYKGYIAAQALVEWIVRMATLNSTPPIRRKAVMNIDRYTVRRLLDKTIRYIYGDKSSYEWPGLMLVGSVEKQSR